MIKRRFFKHEHGDRDGPSDSSSSSDDSEVELESTDGEEEEEDDNVVAEVKQNNVPCSSSGYESGESSADEVDLHSSGLPSSEDDLDSVEKGEDVGASQLFEKRKSGITAKLCSAKAEKDEISSDIPSCVLKTKSVFKCKICPRIICLTEETLRTHLKSKRHARSEKLLSEGRLKIMLNSDGEIETPFEEQETHQERHASTIAAAAAQSCQNSTKSKKKNKGRQRQRKRMKKKTGDVTSEDTKSTKKPPVTSEDTKPTKKPHKKRRQN